MKRRVVITGLGVVSPVGIGKETFWESLLTGVSGAIHLDETTCSSLFGGHEFGAQVVCEVKNFDAVSQGVPPEELGMDRFLQFATVASRQAIQDARLEDIDPSEVGVVLATAICGTQTLDEEFVAVTGKGSHSIHSSEVSPHLYAAAMGNSAALSLASRYGFGGECLTLSTGCVAGVDAIAYAYESIFSGEHDVIVAGASEAPITPITIAAFDIIHCLSHHNEEPTTASRPFSASRDGFVLSEGSGILVLEELEHALRRGVPIYAEIAGWAITEHATHMTDMSPDGRDLSRAVVTALKNADLSSDAVDFVNAHGTSTPQNDVRETQALKAALGERAYTIPINSTKSMIGHSLAAASAIEVVTCALSLQAQQIHPTVNYSDPDPQCDLDYVPNTSRSHEMHWLLTTASGFSGLHAALVMGTYQQGEER